MRDQWNNHQGADEVSPAGRNVKGQFERIGHDRRFKRKEDESKGGVDQRSDRRADVAKAGAARQQIHVQPVTGGSVANRQADQKDNQAGGQDGPEGVDEAAIEHHRRADRFQH